MIMKNKISVKVIAVVSIVVIIIITIFSYFSINTQTQALIAQIKHSANQLSETIKSSTKYDMMLNQAEHVHNIINTIGKQEGIEKVRIFNKEGEVIYSPNKSEIGSFVDKKGEACYACHAADQPLEKLSIPERTRIFTVREGGKNLSIINPIYNEPSCSEANCHAHKADQKVLGVLDVTMSLDVVERQISSSRIELILFALISIISISFILWVLVRKVVGAPVNELVRATNNVANGNLDYRIVNFKEDELGLLGKSFNEMTQKLSEARKQIVQSDKLASLGRLAAGVAHEINNPLTGILTYSTCLLKQADLKKENQDDLEVIIHETRRCSEIVKQLLEFARQTFPYKTTIDLNLVINRALSIISNQMDINNIKVHKKLNNRLPEIKADTNQLHQIFINLLVNAADAMEGQGGEITISNKLIKKRGLEYIQIKIADTGCGIPKENIPQIYDPFYSTKGPKGTGLGLAVVWGIIEKHNGTISVKSEVGKGTVFTLHLPVSGEKQSSTLIETNSSLRGESNVF